MATITLGVQKHRWHPKPRPLPSELEEGRCPVCGEADHPRPVVPHSWRKCAVCNVQKRTIERGRKLARAVRRPLPPNAPNQSLVYVDEYSSDGGKTWSEKPIACPEWWGGLGEHYVAGVLVPRVAR